MKRVLVQRLHFQVPPWTPHPGNPMIPLQLFMKATPRSNCAMNLSPPPSQSTFTDNDIINKCFVNLLQITSGIMEHGSRMEIQLLTSFLLKRDFHGFSLYQVPYKKPYKETNEEEPLCIICFIHFWLYFHFSFGPQRLNLTPNNVNQKYLSATLQFGPVLLASSLDLAPSASPPDLAPTSPLDLASSTSRLKRQITTQYQIITPDCNARL